MRAMQYVKQCSSVSLIFYEQNHPKTAISAVLFLSKSEMFKEYTKQSTLYYITSIICLAKSLNGSNVY